jgi:hypothetical protein
MLDTLRVMIVGRLCSQRWSLATVGSCGLSVRDGSRSLRGALVLLLAFLALFFAQEVYAVPETWFTPVLTEIGNSSSSFGSAVACSAPDSSVGHSWFAVGAPGDSNGEGRVYIAKPSGIVSALQSNAPGSGKQFGAAVTFIGDINGDFTSDLAVGEPNPSGMSGTLHVYISTGNSMAPYSYCASLIGSELFASHILKTSKQVANSAQLVITRTLAGMPGIETRTVSYDTMTGLCQFTIDNDYGSSGSVHSRYGQSVAEVDDGASNSTLLIDAPGLTDGGIYVEPVAGSATLTFRETNGGNYGASIAASASSALLAFSAPHQTTSITVQSQALGAYMPACSLQLPMNDLSTLASHSLAHLGSSFVSFIGEIQTGVNPDAVFASYRDEADTGGAVILFGAHSISGCSVPKEVNNCAFDVNQKQGTAIAGGALCETTGGRKVVLVGSPGFSGNSGRIDLYAEGTESNTPAPCEDFTSSLTPNQMPTFAPVNAATLTPGIESAPIEVDPNTSGLPAPRAETRGKSVSLLAPRLMSPRFQFLGYRWTLIFRGNRKSSVAMPGWATLKARVVKRELFSRRERIAIRNLAPGAYTITYRPVFWANQSENKTILGKFSAQRNFAIRY